MTIEIEVLWVAYGAGNTPSSHIHIFLNTSYLFLHNNIALPRVLDHLLERSVEDGMRCRCICADYK